MTNDDRINEIKTLVLKVNPGSNETALHRIREHISALRIQATDPYCQEKIVSVEGWAAIYFSDCKPEKHRPSHVRSRIIGDCNSVRKNLD